MDKKDDGGPAFAGASGSDGMSLRDWFAGQAMQGMLASFYLKAVSLPHEQHRDLERTVAAAALGFADAMLAAREGGAA